MKGRITAKAASYVQIAAWIREWPASWTRWSRVYTSTRGEAKRTSKRCVRVVPSINTFTLFAEHLYLAACTDGMWLSLCFGFLQGPCDKIWTRRTFEILQLLTKFCHRQSFVIINISTILRKFDKNIFFFIYMLISLFQILKDFRNY